MTLKISNFANMFEKLAIRSKPFGFVPPGEEPRKEPKNTRIVDLKGKENSEEKLSDAEKERLLLMRKLERDEAFLTGEPEITEFSELTRKWGKKADEILAAPAPVDKKYEFELPFNPTYNRDVKEEVARQRGGVRKDVKENAWAIQPSSSEENDQSLFGKELFNRTRTTVPAIKKNDKGEFVRQEGEGYVQPELRNEFYLANIKQAEKKILELKADIDALAASVNPPDQSKLKTKKQLAEEYKALIAQVKSSGATEEQKNERIEQLKMQLESDIQMNTPVYTPATKILYSATKPSQQDYELAEKKGLYIVELPFTRKSIKENTPALDTQRGLQRMISTRMLQIGDKQDYFLEPDGPGKKMVGDSGPLPKEMERTEESKTPMPTPQTYRQDIVRTRLQQYEFEIPFVNSSFPDGKQTVFLPGNGTWYIFIPIQLKNRENTIVQKLSEIRRYYSIAFGDTSRMNEHGKTAGTLDDLVALSRKHAQLSRVR